MVIVGAGLMGAAAAWALTRRDVPVTVLEQFERGHRFGSSHGSARIVRRGYGDPFYVALTGPAFELWDDVAAASGRPLLRMLGSVDFGPDRDVPNLAARLESAGVAHEVMSPVAATERWPGMRFDGDVVFHPQAGTLDADAAVEALLGLAVARGADVRYASPAAVLRPSGAGLAEVELADGTRLPARNVVVTAGGWAGPLLDRVVPVPPLQVTRQSVFHFPRRDLGSAPWPSVIHENGHAVYHLAGGRDGGPGDDRKIGLHDGGPVTTAADRSGGIDPAVRDYLTDYVRRWLPGLEPTPRNETTCLYTATPSEDFFVDLTGGVLVCSACSGHGAKFAPLVGQYVADLVTGAGGPPERFRLAAHLTRRGGNVSL